MADAGVSSHPTVGLFDDLSIRRAAIAVLGLGYVGLPLAVCLATRFRVLGIDTNTAKIARLQAGCDPVGECGDAAIAASGISFDSDMGKLAEARFVIICVPTPIDAARRPDLGPILAASRAVGAHLARGSVVVYESTVYPGCTEEDCIPALEQAGGLKAYRDFTFGYSPERINPGDREHTVERITKVVSGCDTATLDVIGAVYEAVITAGVHRAASVKVAEAAKVIENTQRDLNIALVNELSVIFHRLGIDTLDVLEAAGTKWNFLPFKPGLVGGHCIGVDPFYLTHRAEMAGYYPEVILAGRRINDQIGTWVARECIRMMAARGAVIAGARVLILGITFKEDCPDVRNSKVVDIIDELRTWGCNPIVCDPVADVDEVRREFAIDLVDFTDIETVDGAIMAVAHRAWGSGLTDRLLHVVRSGGAIMDVKGSVDRQIISQSDRQLWRL